MGIFVSILKFCNCVCCVNHVVKQFVERMQQKGYEVKVEERFDVEYHISIKKGFWYVYMSEITIDISCVLSDVYVRVSKSLPIGTALLFGAIPGMVQSSKQAWMEVRVRNILGELFSLNMGQEVYTKEL